MTTLILSGYVLTLVFCVATAVSARVWQAVAFKMARDYATSPAPTPASALVWYSGRARRRLGRAFARL